MMAINNNSDVDCMHTQYSPTFDKVAKFMNIMSTLNNHDSKNSAQSTLDSALSI